MIIDTPYYEDNTRISNSLIGYFIKNGPKYVRNYLDGKVEKVTKPYFEKGTMIHMYILQPEEFWDNYIILDFETPKSEQQKLFAKNFVNSTEFDHNTRVISAYKTAYSVTNKSDDKVLSEGLEMAQKLADYIDYLTKANTGKTIISWSTMNMLKRIKENLDSHKKAKELLQVDKELWEEHNEFHINWDYPHEYEGVAIKCKSLIDRCIIDHTNKKITLIDLKTSFDITDFNSHIKDLDYTRQLAYYWLAIHWYFLKELNIEISEYDKETYIVAIQTTDDNAVKVIKFADAHLTQRLLTIDNAIKALAWHESTGNWDYEKKYYESDGSQMFG